MKSSLAILATVSLLVSASSVMTATPTHARYCLSSTVSAVGGARTTAGAKYFARQHWRRNARNRHGTCFDSYTLSRGKSWHCWREGRRHRHCQVTAHPCSTCGALYD